MVCAGTQAAEYGVHRYLSDYSSVYVYRHVPSWAILEFLLAVGAVAFVASQVLDLLYVI